MLLHSLDEFDACKSSTCSVVSLGAPLVQFQNLEEKDTLQGFRPYVCHVKPKARFEVLEDKESIAPSATNCSFSKLRFIECFTLIPFE